MYDGTAVAFCEKMVEHHVVGLREPWILTYEPIQRKMASHQKRFVVRCDANALLAR